MDTNYLIENCGLTQKQIDRYRKAHIIEDSRDMSDDFIRDLGLAVSMEGVGISLTEIQQYLEMKREPEKNRGKMLKFWEEKRKSALDQLHDSQKSLDLIDFYRYELKGINAVG